MKIEVALQPPYVAEIESGSRARLGALARAVLAPGARAVVVTVPPVWQAWGAAAEASLQAAGVAYTLLTMPDGELHKNLATLATLAEAMAASGAGRDALIIAFGGGVAGDMGGLLASLYMRGVNLLQVPTTLLAMVDSSLGGKTGVDLAAGKNLVGTFHHPRAILVDPEYLSTLPPREFRAGMAEAIKYAVIRDPELFAWLEASAPLLAHREAAALEHLIATCLRHKAAIVAADERESDLRRVLNFGHTLGHALESATNFETFRHGEAVAWGMIAAARIATATGRLTAAESDRVTALVLRECAPLPPVRVSPGEVLEHAARDKKNRAGVMHFVLPTAVGAVTIANDVPEAVVRDVLASLR